MPGLTPRSTSDLPDDLPHWIEAYGLFTAFGPGDGTPITVGYTLDETGTDGFGRALRTLTAGEIYNIERSLLRLEHHTGLSFEEVSAETADMRIGASSDPDVIEYGRAWQYTTQAVAVVAYDVVYSSPTGLANNSYIYIHELLHGVGLAHSTNAFNSTLDVVIPEHEHTGTTLFGSWSSGWTGYPQLFDLAVLQYLYGPDPEARAGDDTYVPSLAGFNPQNFDATTPLLWDGGGSDTIDLSAADGPATATLAPGPISRINTENDGILEAGTFSINYNSVFEAMLGTDYDDTLTGWIHDEWLTGSNGADVIDGKGGADSLHGGSGKDTLIGGAGADHLEGKNGKDKLKGGKGADELKGGKGRDKLEGAKGRDELTGGADADKFIFDRAKTTSTDTITDFEDGLDMIQFKSSGAFGDLTIEDTEAGARVAWGNGNVVLEGIEADQLTEADFIFPIV